MKPQWATILMVLMLSVSAIAPAAEPIQSNAFASNDDAVLTELARRSAVPATELKALLANCDANQQSMFFCAYRDQVAADLTLDQLLAKKTQAFPRCKATLKAKIASWEYARDRSCAKAAQQERGGGSMQPTANALCLTAQTTKMVQKLQQSHTCSALSAVYR